MNQASVAQMNRRAAGALLSPEQARALIREIRSHSCDPGCARSHSHLEYSEALQAALSWLLPRQESMAGKSPAYVKKLAGQAVEEFRRDGGLDQYERTQAGVILEKGKRPRRVNRQAKRTYRQEVRTPEGDVDLDATFELIRQVGNLDAPEGVREFIRAGDFDGIRTGLRAIYGDRAELAWWLVHAEGRTIRDAAQDCGLSKTHTRDMAAEIMSFVRDQFYRAALNPPGKLRRRPTDRGCGKGMRDAGQWWQTLIKKAATL